MWYGKYNVVMLYGQGVLHQVVDPECLFGSLTFRAMPVATTVVTVAHRAQLLQCSSCPPRVAVRQFAIFPNTFCCSGVRFTFASRPLPKRSIASASSKFVRIARIVIEGIQRTVRFKQFALCHVQVDHCSGDLSMAKKFFDRYNVQPLLKQMGGKGVPE